MTTRSSGSESMGSGLEELSKLLVHPDQKLLITLRGVISSKDVHQLAESFVKVFEHEGKTLSLIEHLIISEIEATMSSGTLFRTNSLASKVMTIWSRLGEGLEYLTSTLSAPYGSLEINPEHAKPEEDLNANITQLSSIAQEILDCITNSVDHCPLAFRVVCSYLKTHCEKKFPSQSLLAVGGFIILRFFSAALVTPETNGLLEDAPSLDARRILVLISKTIQNLANRAWFRESFMDALNKFLELNQDKMTTFLENVSQVPAFAEGATPQSNQISSEEYDSALNTLADICQRNIKFMEAQVPDPDPGARKAFVEELRGILAGFQPSGSGNASPLPSDSPMDPHKAKEDRKKKEKEQKNLDKKNKELEKVEKLVAKGKKPKSVAAEELPRRRRDLRIQMEQMIAENLTQAAALGNVVAIEEILSKEKKMVNVSDREGQTALHHACSNGHVAALRVLLKLKADCYLQDKRGWTALHCAVFANHEEIISELCKQHHIDLSTPNDDENTPLHYFARNPFTKSMEGLLKMFLNGGADINAQNTNLETPLHMAVWKANPGMISLLLENGADPKIANNKGETPWDWALRLKNPELVAVFEKAIKQRAMMPISSHSIVRKQQNPLMADATLRSKFFLDAVRENQVDTVKELLKLDKKLADQTFGVSKNSALHFAAIRGYLSITKLILRAATKIVKNVVGWTPLMAALWQGHEESALAIMLSRHIVDINAKLEDGNTALHFASRHSGNLSEFVIFSLVEHGAEINGTNANGDTPLHFAVRGGRPEVVKSLLENGANRQKANKDHETPMDVAQKAGNTTILNILLDKPESQIESEPPTSPTSASFIESTSNPTPIQQQQQQQTHLQSPPVISQTTQPPPPSTTTTTNQTSSSPPTTSPRTLPQAPQRQISSPIPSHKISIITSSSPSPLASSQPLQSQQQQQQKTLPKPPTWTQLSERIAALSTSSTQAEWDKFISVKQLMDKSLLMGTEQFKWPPNPPTNAGERRPTLRDVQCDVINRIAEVQERLKRPQSGNTNSASETIAVAKLLSAILSIWPPNASNEYSPPLSSPSSTTTAGSS